MDAIHPAQRYQRTILDGRGSCSDMVKGLAYYLERENIDYRLVSILPRKNFLKGWGHTLLELPMRLDGQDARLGLLDVSEGGILQVGSRWAGRTDLTDAAGRLLKIRKLARHPRPKAAIEYDVLLESSTVGYTDAGEMKRHFDFIRAIYVPLGNAWLEHRLYTLVSLLAGFYPAIHVESVEQTFPAGFMPWRTLFLAALWAMRIALAILVLLVAAYPVLRFLGRRAQPAAGSCR